jgi:predicted AAA+ superfamily ATPase
LIFIQVAVKYHQVIPRHLEAALRAALADAPATFLGGPRQVGKTTLARQLVGQGLLDAYVTFDDLTALAAARRDPQGFVNGLPPRVVVDEVQRAPEVLLPLKAAIDRDRIPGRILLTGSASPEAVPRIAEALAGRVELLTLWPFSQGELENHAESFLRTLFSDGRPRWHHPPIDRAALLDRVARGGYPENLRRTPPRRAAWFESYVTTLLMRDVLEFARIDGTVELPRLLRLLAFRTAQPINHSDLARELGIPQTTTKRYVALLQAACLVRALPPWFTNTSKRLVKSAKWLVTDSGLATHLCGLDALEPDHPLAGPLLETFVGCELLRQMGWDPQRLGLHHFRAHTGEEVDWVLERADGTVAGIEVKLAARVGESDLRGMRLLRELAGKRFRRGVVLYSGTEVIGFDSDLQAVPMTALWH